MHQIDTPAFEAATRLLTAEDVAEILGLRRDTLYHWRLRGVGPRGIKVGGRLRFRPSDVDAWLDAQRDER